MEIEVKSTHEFNDFAARRILSIIEHSVDHQGHCSVALSGGNTPREVYEAIVRLQNDFDINWKRVFFFWGDERLVPSDDLSSNTRMAYENLLDRLLSRVLIFSLSERIFLFEEAAADMEEK
jgi:6-phosphogluconolactonase